MCAVLQVGRLPQSPPIHPYIYALYAQLITREFQCFAAGFSASVLHSARAPSTTTCALSAPQCLFGSRKDARVVVARMDNSLCVGGSSIATVCFNSLRSDLHRNTRHRRHGQAYVTNALLRLARAVCPIHNGSSDATGGFPCTGALTAMPRALERCVRVSARGFDSWQFSTFA